MKELLGAWLAGRNPIPPFVPWGMIVPIPLELADDPPTFAGVISEVWVELAKVGEIAVPTVEWRCEVVETTVPDDEHPDGYVTLQHATLHVKAMIRRERTP